MPVGPPTPGNALQGDDSDEGPMSTRIANDAGEINEPNRSMGTHQTG